jgi:hypothetical protein
MTVGPSVMLISTVLCIVLSVVVVANQVVLVINIFSYLKLLRKAAFIMKENLE